ncbi:DUF2188 domain-containing protein [Agromyces sp. ISL-38]|uniref:DUF2188 domain-containing protein n=1 Tax=Agromyces sp. ISL-38 TaxID=2819107 RepID=UPI001BE83696|nr:DUF2188 domain-containing protein [Agromyces sp. ISL-38]MBT2498397.1 DUF2188 domain-containing protein [Agromyces sp. ISL-38]MBT2518969.1 DUF2188 domain-containing protein [Streptomyces sp. ISL-90]
MNDGDVVTMSKRGQWVNRVIGGEELSESFRSREEAVEAGRSLALQLGSKHVVLESEETGVITDEGEASL